MAIIPAHNATDLTNALSSCAAGDIIELDAGATYDGTFILPVKSGASAGTPLTIRSSGYASLPSGRVSPANATNMARVRTTSTDAAFKTATNAAYWTLDGLEITDNAGTATVAGLLVIGANVTGVNHTTITRCYIHQKETETTTYERSSIRGIISESTDITVKWCYIGPFVGYPYGYYLIPDNTPHQTNAFECEVVGSNILLEDNFLSAWYTVMFLGGADSGPAHTATLSSGATTTSATFSDVSRIAESIAAGDLPLIQLELDLAGTLSATDAEALATFTRTSGAVLSEPNDIYRSFDFGGGGVFEIQDAAPSRTAYVTEIPQRQLETADIVGTITGSGNAIFTVTSSLVTGSPLAVNVAVLAGDSPTTVATKAVAALAAVSAISSVFTVSNENIQHTLLPRVTLKKTTAAANDGTLNIAYANGTCTGLTNDATSTHTRTGGTDTNVMLIVWRQSSTHPAAGSYNAIDYKTVQASSVAGSVVTYAPWGSDLLTQAPSTPGGARWAVLGEGLISNITLRKNSIYDEPLYGAFQSAHSSANSKGYWEVKNCYNMVIEGNYFYGYPTLFSWTGNNQNGMSPWMTVSHIIIRNNFFMPDTLAGFNITAIYWLCNQYNSTTTPRDFQVYNNVFGPSLADTIKVQTCADVEIYHNTFLNDGPTYSGYSCAFEVEGVVTNFSYHDNIAGYQKDGMKCLASGCSFAGSYPGGVWSKNAIIETRFDTTGGSLTTSTWGSNSLLAPTTLTSMASVGFTDRANNNFRLLPTSPFYHAATGGTDPGVNWDTLIAALGFDPSGAAPSTPSVIVRGKRKVKMQ